MMRRSTRGYLSLFAILTALVSYALFAYYPAFPKSIRGWSALIFVGLPLLFLFEWIGEKTLGSDFFGRLPGWARIVLGVPVFVLLMMLVLWLAHGAAYLIDR